MGKEVRRLHLSVLPMIIFVVLSALLIVGGFYFNHERSAFFRRQEQDGMIAVTKIKIDQILNWRSERIQDGLAAISHPGVIEAIKKISNNRQDTQARKTLHESNKIFVTNRNYQRVWLVDPNNNVLFVDPDTNCVKFPDDVVTAKVVQTIPENIVKLHDFHLLKNGKTCIDVVAPYFDNDSKKVVATLLLQIDPHRDLYPLIQQFPMPSRTTECLLLRINGDSVEFLNDFRFQTNTSPRFHSMRSSWQSAITKSVLDKRNFFSTTDYRGVEVYATLHRIPDSPWYLLTKVDVEEIATPSRVFGGYVLLVILLAIVAIGGVTGLWWYRREARFIREALSAEERKQELLQQVEILFQNANDAILIFDSDYIISRVNKRAEVLYGYSKNELVGLEAWRLRSENSPTSFETVMQEARSHNQQLHEAIHRRSDGLEIYVEVGTNTIELGGKMFYQSIVRDISERKQSELQLLRVNRLFSFLSGIDKVIVNSFSRDTLLKEVCRIAVEQGGLRMAWIGEVDPETKEIVPVAIEGFEEGYFSEIRISANQEPVGYGPVGTAVRERRVDICNDIRNEARMLPWLNAALKRGYESIAALPVFCDSELCAILALYSEQPFFFSSREKQLLEEITTDLSNALDMLKQKAERSMFERALADSEERFRSLFVYAPLSYFSVNQENKIITVNQTWLDTMRYNRDDVVGHTIIDFFAESARLSARDYFQRISAQENNITEEFGMIRKDGSTIIVSLIGRAGKDDNGNFLRTHCILIDVSEQKKIERAFQEQYSTMHGILESSLDPIFAVDRDFNLLSYNRAFDNWAREIFQGTAEIGKNLLDVITDLVEAEGAQRDITTAMIGGARSVEICIPTGEERHYYLTTMSPILNHSGETTGVAVMAKEITERKHAEETALDNERRFRLLFDNMMTACLIVKPLLNHMNVYDDAEIVAANRPLELIVNEKNQRIIGHKLSDILPHLLSICRDRLDKVVRDSEGIRFEQYLRETSKFLEISVFKVQNDSVVFMIRDITDRKLNENALRSSEERFELAVKGASVGIWDRNFQTNEAYYSTRYKEILGYSDSDIPNLPKTWRDFIHPEDEDRIAQAITQHLQNHEPYDIDYRMRTKSGEYRWVNSRGQAYWNRNGTPVRFVGSLMDIHDRVQFELALQESAKQIQRQLEEIDQIFACSPVGLFVLDRDFRFQRINARLAEINGIPVEQHIGKSLLEMFPHMRDYYINLFQPIFQKGVSAGNVETYGRNRSKNEEAYLLGNYFPLKNEQGEIVGLVGAVLEITERKHSEQALRVSELRARALFENSGDAISLYNRDRKLIFVTPSIESVLGYSAQEYLTMFRDEIIHPDDRKTFLDTQEQIFLGTVQSVHSLFRARHRDGSIRWMDHTFRNLYSDPNVGLAVANMRDVTESVSSAEQIQQLNTELEERVKQRTAALEAANHELEAFSYSVSHDLRAPLRAIDSFAKIVLDEYGPGLDAEGIRLLNIVCNNTNRMGKLIDDLLSFSRVGRSELIPWPISLSSLVQNEFLELTSEAQRQRIDFTVKEMPDTLGDPSLIRQVWTNLLGNAIKYSSIKGRSSIEVGSTVIDGEIVYYIKDNGVGFDMKYRDKLFGVFQRLHSMDQFEGTGVGLAIVQRIVHRHHGRVWAEAAVNQGATFYFTLHCETRAEND